MRAAQEAGIRHFVIVTGYQAERLQSAIEDHQAITADVTFVNNPFYRSRSNGTSALAAAPVVDKPFALLMADHIFEVETLRRFLRTPIGPREAILAVDRKIAQVFDLDDATKVVETDGRVHAIGKEIPDYNAIDTGMFLCTPTLFEALHAVQDEGDGSLSDAVRWLSARGNMRTFDIGDAVWQDVDTPEMRREAERRLGNGLRKATDGPVSRVINRRISIPISLLLTRTAITPNQISVFNLLIASAAGLLFASTSYQMLALGGILLQLGSILDGCDGEVARLTFRQSKNGQWMDTITDNISYVVLVIGLGIGQFRREPTTLTVWLALASLAAILIGLVVIYQRIHAMGKGSLLDFKIPSRDLVDPVTGRVFWMYEQLLPLIRRDIFAFGICLLALANLPSVVFGLWVLGSVMFMLGVIHVSSERVQRQLTPSPAVVKES
jgi:CDP-L-myo-inositol myo-inositolphosphotransferase